MRIGTGSVSWFNDEFLFLQVFCFTVAGKFGVIIIKVIKNMISRSADEASEPSEETETKNNLTNTYIVGRVIVS